MLDGLKPGEQVIVEGFQKMRPGAPVKPVPWAGARRAGARTAASASLRATLPARRRRPAAEGPHAMAQFFIDRPIFAWVIALFIVVGGAVSITQLPVAQYPTVAPPAIVVTVAYPGASAQDAGRQRAHASSSRR